MTIQKLKKIAAGHGATIETEAFHPTNRALVAIAPDGKQWVCGQCIHLVSEYITYIKSGYGSREEAIMDLAIRMDTGLEDLDETINP